MAGLLGGLQLGDDAGETLRQRVVDLPGHPLPLLEHAGLAGLVEQLGVQLGVLLQGGLEPFEQLPALLSSCISFIPMKLKYPVSPVCRTMMKIQPETAWTVGSGKPAGAV